jgi:uncharacterized protein (DUF362 family)
MGASERRGVNRRDFLARSAVAATALAAGRGLVRAAEAKPMVVVVRDKSQSSIDRFTPNAEVVQRLVDQAVMRLAGKDDVAKAWATFVSPKDKVAVKFNGLFRRATTHPEVIDAACAGMVKAGVDPANITVYDRKSRDFKTTGFDGEGRRNGYRLRATDGDYGPSLNAGPVGTRLTKILAEADVLVNVPMLKSHVRCGVTGALKNHLGTVPNAGAFHKDCCAAIADLNALGPIKDKTRVCLCDGLYGLFDGGPAFRGDRCRFDYHGILAATDPVAMDAVVEAIIRAARVAKGLKPHLNDPKHIARAADLGLGEADLARIDRVEMQI